MARPNRSSERRRALTPVLAKAFAELGYRRATSAELAARCGMPENVLYRLWPDKKRMFLAAVEHVFDASAAAWARLDAQDRGGASNAERLLRHEALHHGEHGLYRIVFAGLSELDDPAIRRALAQMYARFVRRVGREIAAHRGDADLAKAELSAWAMIGLGTAASIGRELGVLSARKRARLFADVGRVVLGPRRG